MFSVYTPCGNTQFGSEFGINDFNGQMLFHAPEPIALAYLEALYWGTVDERQRSGPMSSMLMAQSTHRLGEIHRLEAVIVELRRVLKSMWPYYWGPQHEALRTQAKALVEPKDPPLSTG